MAGAAFLPLWMATTGAGVLAASAVVWAL